MLVVHKHAHSGESNQAAAFGWMVESLLQQRDIAYFAKNYVVNMNYVYNPEQERIEIVF